jgi:hypothetical protein
MLKVVGLGRARVLRFRAWAGSDPTVKNVMGFGPGSGPKNLKIKFENCVPLASKRAILKLTHKCQLKIKHDLPIFIIYRAGPDSGLIFLNRVRAPKTRP